MVFGSSVGGMGKEKVPALVTVKGLQGQERFVASPTPELADTLEASLVLAAGGLDGPGADRFSSRLGLSVVHPLLMVLEVADFPLEILALSLGELEHGLLQRLQLLNDVQCAIGLVVQVAQQGPNPRVSLRSAPAMEGMGQFP